MGSRSKINLSYIAGFLDGDGSLMLQIKKRGDTPKGIRFMPVICFYQDTRHDRPLTWIKKVLGIGYLSYRNDGMTELRINGYKQIREILKSLLPYIRFKQIQAKALVTACEILLTEKLKNLEKKKLSKLVDLVLVIQKENYTTKKKKTKNELYKILGLTP